MGLGRGEKNPVTCFTSKSNHLICFLYPKPSQNVPHSPTTPGAILVQEKHGRVQNLPGHHWADAVGKTEDAVRMLLAHPQELRLVFWV